MYYKNISLHLAYLQKKKKKKKKNFVKEICKIVIFFLNKKNLISSKFFKNLCLYYPHLRDIRPRKLFIICKIS